MGPSSCLGCKSELKAETPWAPLHGCTTHSAYLSGWIGMSGGYPIRLLKSPWSQDVHWPRPLPRRLGDRHAAWLGYCGKNNSKRGGKNKTKGKNTKTKQKKKRKSGPSGSQAFQTPGSLIQHVFWVGRTKCGTENLKTHR